MRVLFVSKPIREPFHDGSVCLVREIATSLEAWQASVMGVRGAPPWPLESTNAEVLPVYRQPGKYAPGLVQNARALLHLTFERRADLWHFVFAPNPRSSGLISALRRFRSVPSVQTIASPPKSFAGVGRLLFGDVVVAQSDWTRQRVEADARGRNVQMIRPPLGAVPRSSDEVMAGVRARLNLEPGQRVVVYPGDLEFSTGAEIVAKAVPGLIEAIPDCVVVFACRRKTPRAREVEARLQGELDPRRVRFAGELPSLLPLLQLADCVLFPVEQLWAKVDIPIAVLESMALGTPVVLPDQGPLAELCENGRIRAAESGALVRATVAAVTDSDFRRQWVGAQRDLIAAAFDARVVAGQYERLYSNLVPSR